MLAFDRPWLLVLLLPCLLPLLGSGATPRGIASLSLVPRDFLSDAIDGLLRLLMAASMAAIVVGLAGLHRERTSVVRTGTGAHVVIVLDRSLSMAEPFARTGEVAHESKTAAASRLLRAFLVERPHDVVGVVGFSTEPISVMPLTEHRDAVAAALAAMRRPPLANTNIGGGLAYGMSMFARDDAAATRVLLFVSDGAGIIGDETQNYLRVEAQRQRVHIYYLYLRAGDDPPLDEDMTGRDDSTQPAALDAFFRTLGVPYRGFEALDPGAVAAAVAEIARLENQPLQYREFQKRRDEDGACFAMAAVCLGAFLLARLAERAGKMQPSPQPP